MYFMNSHDLLNWLLKVLVILKTASPILITKSRVTHILFMLTQKCTLGSPVAPPRCRGRKGANPNCQRYQWDLSSNLNRCY